MDIKEQKSLKKQFLIYSIGILNSLQQNLITPNEAFSILFKPTVTEWLIENKFDKELIELIDKATELEDIKELVPHSYEKILTELHENALKQLKEIPEIQMGSIFWNKNVLKMFET